jgi:hypothetical protein
LSEREKASVAEVNNWQMERIAQEFLPEAERACVLRSQDKNIEARKNLFDTPELTETQIDWIFDLLLEFGLIRQGLRSSLARWWVSMNVDRP